MRILIVNDDGYSAPGLAALVKVLKGEHELLICAPRENQSAVGHGITLRELLYISPVVLAEASEVAAYCVSGKPSDCVRIALGNLGFEPDLVISGINMAPNLGTDVIYSGTVAAAEEAAMLGYNAIALSKDTLSADYFNDAAEIFVQLLPSLVKCFTPYHRLLNVNFPSLPKAQYRGVRAATLVEQVYPISYKQIEDEDGGIGLKINSTKLTVCAPEDTTDEKYIRDGFITVTPLKYDIADHDRLAAVSQIMERDFDV